MQDNPNIDISFVYSGDSLSFLLEPSGILAIPSLKEPLPEYEEKVTHLRSQIYRGLQYLDYRRCVFRLESEYGHNSQLFFGSVVHLVHYPTNLIVVGTKFYDPEINGNYQSVFLRTKEDLKDDLSFKWTIIPKFKLREEGDPLRVGDYILLRNLQYRKLILAISQPINYESRCEGLVSLSGEDYTNFSMKVIRISSHKDEKKMLVDASSSEHINYVYGNDYIRLVHQEYKAHLISRIDDEKEIKSVVAPLGSVSRKLISSKTSNYLPLLRPLQIQQPDKSYDFFSSYSPLGIWQIILDDNTELGTIGGGTLGGSSQWGVYWGIQNKLKNGAKIRLRHAASGQYLAIRPVDRSDSDNLKNVAVHSNLLTDLNSTYHKNVKRSYDGSRHNNKESNNKVMNSQDLNSPVLQNLTPSQSNNSPVVSPAPSLPLNKSLPVVSPKPQYRIKILSLQASNLRNVEWFGKNNPYISLSFHNRLQVQTSHIEQGGQMATFNLETNHSHSPSMISSAINTTVKTLSSLLVNQFQFEVSEVELLSEPLKVSVLTKHSVFQDTIIGQGDLLLDNLVSQLTHQVTASASSFIATASSFLPSSSTYKTSYSVPLLDRRGKTAGFVQIALSIEKIHENIEENEDDEDDIEEENKNNEDQLDDNNSEVNDENYEIAGASSNSAVAAASLDVLKNYVTVGTSKEATKYTLFSIKTLNKNDPNDNFITYADNIYLESVENNFIMKLFDQNSKVDPDNENVDSYDQEEEKKKEIPNKKWWEYRQDKQLKPHKYIPSSSNSKYKTNFIIDSDIYKLERVNQEEINDLFFSLKLVPLTQAAISTLQLTPDPNELFLPLFRHFKNSLYSYCLWVLDEFSLSGSLVSEKKIKRKERIDEINEEKKKIEEKRQKKRRKRSFFQKKKREEKLTVDSSPSTLSSPSVTSPSSLFSALKNKLVNNNEDKDEEELDYNDIYNTDNFDDEEDDEENDEGDEEEDRLESGDLNQGFNLQIENEDDFYDMDFFNEDDDEDFDEDKRVSSFSPWLKRKVTDKFDKSIKDESELKKYIKKIINNKTSLKLNEKILRKQIIVFDIKLFELLMHFLNISFLLNRSLSLSNKINRKKRSENRYSNRRGISLEIDSEDYRDEDDEEDELPSIIKDCCDAIHFFFFFSIFNNKKNSLKMLSIHGNFLSLISQKIIGWNPPLELLLKIICNNKEDGEDEQEGKKNEDDEDDEDDEEEETKTLLDDILVNSITSNDLRQILEQMKEMYSMSFSSLSANSSSSSLISTSSSNSGAENILSLLKLLCQSGKAKEYFQSTLVKFLIAFDNKYLNFSSINSLKISDDHNEKNNDILANSLLFSTIYDDNQWKVIFHTKFSLPPQESRSLEVISIQLLREGNSLKDLFNTYNTFDVIQQNETEIEAEDDDDENKVSSYFENSLLDLEECFCLLEDLGYGGSFLYEEIGNLIGSNFFGFLNWWCYRASFYYPSSSVSQNQLSPIQIMNLLKVKLSKKLLFDEKKRKKINKNIIINSLRYYSIINSRVSSFNLYFKDSNNTYGRKRSHHYTPPVYNQNFSEKTTNRFGKKSSKLPSEENESKLMTISEAFSSSSPYLTWFRQSLSLLSYLCQDKNIYAQRIISLLLPPELLMSSLLNPGITSSYDRSLLLNLLINLYINHDFVYPTRSLTFINKNGGEGGEGSEGGGQEECDENFNIDFSLNFSYNSYNNSSFLSNFSNLKCPFSSNSLKPSFIPSLNFTSNFLGYNEEIFTSNLSSLGKVFNPMTKFFFSHQGNELGSNLRKKLYKYIKNRINDIKIFANDKQYLKEVDSFLKLLLLLLKNNFFNDYTYQFYISKIDKNTNLFSYFSSTFTSSNSSSTASSVYFDHLEEEENYQSEDISDQFNLITLESVLLAKINETITQHKNKFSNNENEEKNVLDDELEKLKMQEISEKDNELEQELKRRKELEDSDKIYIEKVKRNKKKKNSYEDILLDLDYFSNIFSNYLYVNITKNIIKIIKEIHFLKQTLRSQTIFNFLMNHTINLSNIVYKNNVNINIPSDKIFKKVKNNLTPNLMIPFSSLNSDLNSEYNFLLKNNKDILNNIIIKSYLKQIKWNKLKEVLFRDEVNDNYFISSLFHTLLHSNNSLSKETLSILNMRLSLDHNLFYILQNFQLIYNNNQDEKLPFKKTNDEYKYNTNSYLYFRLFSINSKYLLKILTSLFLNPNIEKPYLNNLMNFITYNLLNLLFREENDSTNPTISPYPIENASGKDKNIEYKVIGGLNNVELLSDFEYISNTSFSSHSNLHVDSINTSFSSFSSSQNEEKKKDQFILDLQQVLSYYFNNGDVFLTLDEETSYANYINLIESDDNEMINLYEYFSGYNKEIKESFYELYNEDDENDDDIDEVEINGSFQNNKLREFELDNNLDEFNIENIKKFVKIKNLLKFFQNYNKKTINFNTQNNIKILLSNIIKKLLKILKLNDKKKFFSYTLYYQNLFNSLFHFIHYLFNGSIQNFVTNSSQIFFSLPQVSTLSTVDNEAISSYIIILLPLLPHLINFYPYSDGAINLIHLLCQYLSYHDLVVRYNLLNQIVIKLKNNYFACFNGIQKKLNYIKIFFICSLLKNSDKKIFYSFTLGLFLFGSNPSSTLPSAISSSTSFLLSSPTATTISPTLLFIKNYIDSIYKSNENNDDYYWYNEKIEDVANDEFINKNYNEKFEEKLTIIFSPIYLLSFWYGEKEKEGSNSKFTSIIKKLQKIYKLDFLLCLINNKKINYNLKNLINITLNFLYNKIDKFFYNTNILLKELRFIRAFLYLASKSNRFQNNLIVSSPASSSSPSSISVSLFSNVSTNTFTTIKNYFFYSILSINLSLIYQLKFINRKKIINFTNNLLSSLNTNFFNNKILFFFIQRQVIYDLQLQFCSSPLSPSSSFVSPSSPTTSFRSSTPYGISSPTDFPLSNLVTFLSMLNLLFSFDLKFYYFLTNSEKEYLIWTILCIIFLIQEKNNLIIDDSSNSSPDQEMLRRYELRLIEIVSGLLLEKEIKLSKNYLNDNIIKMLMDLSIRKLTNIHSLVKQDVVIPSPIPTPSLNKSLVGSPISLSTNLEDLFSFSADSSLSDTLIRDEEIFNNNLEIKLIFTPQFLRSTSLFKFFRKILNNSIKFIDLSGLMLFNSEIPSSFSVSNSLSSIKSKKLINNFLSYSSFNIWLKNDGKYFIILFSYLNTINNIKQKEYNLIHIISLLLTHNIDEIRNNNFISLTKRMSLIALEKKRLKCIQNALASLGGLSCVSKVLGRVFYYSNKESKRKSKEKNNDKDKVKDEEMSNYSIEDSLEKIIEKQIEDIYEKEIENNKEKILRRREEEENEKYIWFFTPLLLKLGSELLSWQNLELQNNLIDNTLDHIYLNKPPELNFLLGLQFLIRSCITEITSASSFSSITHRTIKTLRVSIHIFKFCGTICSGNNEKGQKFLGGLPANSKFIVNITEDLNNLNNTLIKKLLEMVIYIDPASLFYDKVSPYIYNLKNNEKRRFLSWYNYSIILPPTSSAPITNAQPTSHNTSSITTPIVSPTTSPYNFYLILKILKVLSINFDNLITLCCLERPCVRSTTYLPQLIEFLGLVQLKIKTKSTASSTSALSSKNIVWYGGDPFLFYKTYLKEMNAHGVLTSDSDYPKILNALQLWQQALNFSTKSKNQKLDVKKHFKLIFGVNFTLFSNVVKKCENDLLRFVLSSIEFINNEEEKKNLINKFNDTILIQNVDQHFQLLLSNKLSDNIFSNSINFLRSMTTYFSKTFFPASSSSSSSSIINHLELETATTVAYISLIESIGIINKETDELLALWDSNYLLTYNIKPSSFYGCVEINGNDNRLRRLYFPVPFFISSYWDYPEVQKVKETIVMEINRKNPEEKLTDFLNYMNKLIIILKRQEKLKMMLNFFIHSILGGKSIFFFRFLPSQRVILLCLTIILNVYFVYYNTEPNTLPFAINSASSDKAYFSSTILLKNNNYISFTQWRGHELFVFIIQWTHFILSALIAIRTILNSDATDNLDPLINVKKILSGKKELGDDEEEDNDEDEDEEDISHRNNSLLKRGLFHFFNIFAVLINYSYYFLVLFFSSIWTVFLTVLSFFALKGYYWLYVPCLSDVIFLIDSMYFLYVAISRNISRVFFTLILAFLCLYFYSIISFLFFGNQFNLNEKYDCEDPGSCFKLHLDYGLYSTPQWDSEGYINPKIKLIYFDFPYSNIIQYSIGTFYNLTYVILINLVLQAIISGLIIDSFQAMREENEEILEDIANKCFICSISRDVFDQSNINFRTHIRDEHNMWHYAWFKIYLELKDPLSYSATENYAWKAMQDSKTFIKMMPIKQSLSINTMTITNEENNKQGESGSSSSTNFLPDQDELEKLMAVLNGMQEKQQQFNTSLGNLQTNHTQLKEFIQQVLPQMISTAASQAASTAIKNELKQSKKKKK